MTKILDPRLSVRPSEVLTRRRNENAGYLRHGSILLPDRLAKEVRELCGTCGVPLVNVKTAMHFGQIFCATCAGKMKHGEKP